ncbi:MAG: hypothetical protein K6G87_00990 [Butyrivibrio sp.]|uniref:hypothetical protein n=1 Tax=Butyrivibrio sp. TaxID=28121 RepID=UPI0025D309C6|nr:hypothetical protein [Butyrivibrio sp.]MCR5769788.1 hypothetical protein [Butyrivibrio sp.]
MNFKKVTTGVLAGAMLASLAAVPVSAADEHHAYIQFQTSGYAFRNSWDESSYGLNNDAGYDYSKIQGWNGSEHEYREGTLTDAVITGDGTYTVSVKGAQFEDRDFSATADSDYNMLMVSTDLDIELLDPDADNGFSIVVDSLVIDGKTIDVSNHQIADYEADSDYASVELQNVYDNNHPDLKKLDGLTKDAKDIEITFTVKGLGGSEAAGDVAPVVYLAALAAIAGIAMVASKKRA